MISNQTAQRTTSCHKFMIDLNQGVQTQMPSKAVGIGVLWGQGHESEGSARSFKLTNVQPA